MIHKRIKRHLYRFFLILLVMVNECNISIKTKLSLEDSDLRFWLESEDDILWANICKYHWTSWDTARHALNLLHADCRMPAAPHILQPSPVCLTSNHGKSVRQLSQCFHIWRFHTFVWLRASPLEHGFGTPNRDCEQVPKQSQFGLTFQLVD